VLRSAYRSPGVTPERQPVVADRTAVLGRPTVVAIIETGAWRGKWRIGPQGRPQPIVTGNGRPIPELS
jgi:hypothetical protein